MSPLPRLLSVSAILVACLFVSPARSGEWLPLAGCDTLSTSEGETSYDFQVFNHNGPSVCTTELRPVAYGALAAAPILSWQVPDGWTAEWIAGEPGAIALRGCVREWSLSPVLRITMAGRAGAIVATFRPQDGPPLWPYHKTFWCGSAPVPAAVTSWGQIKSTYR